MSSVLNGIGVGGRNLLTGTDVTYTRTNAATAVVNEGFKVVDGYDLNTLIGKTVTISVFINAPGTRDTSLATSSLMNNRFGGHSTEIWANDSSDTTTTYKSTTLLIKTVSNERVSQTITLTPPSGYTKLNSITFNYQGYAKPASDNTATWVYSRPKMEIGDTATDWTPAPEDIWHAGYIDPIVGQTCTSSQYPNSVYSDLIQLKSMMYYTYGFDDESDIPDFRIVVYTDESGTVFKENINLSPQTNTAQQFPNIEDCYCRIVFPAGLTDDQIINFYFKEDKIMAIKASNQISIVDVTDAYSVILTSEAFAFASTDPSGIGPGGSCTTQAVAYCGTNQCSSVTVDASAISCPASFSATVENSGTSAVTIKFTLINNSLLSAGTYEATIPVTVDGITVNKKFTMTVVCQGKTGATGATGNGIKSTAIEYQSSTSNTTIPTGTWSTTIPSVAAGSYLWTRTTLTYTDNTTSVGYSVAKQGTTGTTGSQWYSGTAITGTSTTATVFSSSGVSSARVNDMYLNTSTGNTYKCTTAGAASAAKWVYTGNIKGTTGAKGATGETGNGIESAAITYQAGSSATTAPTGTWVSSPPSVTAGRYLWTKTVFTYTNGDTDTQYSVARQGANGAAGADAITLSITTSNGTVFKNSTGSTVLTAHVYKAGAEQTITDAGVCGSLGSVKWYLAGSTTALATAKTYTVSATDVTNVAAYTCQLES